MSYTNIFNILNTVIRTANRKDGLILPPLSKIVTLPQGYYSPKVKSNVSDEDNSETFTLSGVEYVRRHGVNFNVELTGSLEKLMSIFKINKPEINKAELHILTKRITDSAWNVVGKRVCEDYLLVTQKNNYKVQGEIFEDDLYAGIYSIIHYIIYDVIAKNRCEYSKDIELVVLNIKSLEEFWGKSSPDQERMAIHIGSVVDKFIGTFVQPYMNVETSKVGQAHVNENMSSILSQYEGLKNKIACIAGNQIDQDRYFTILSDYLEHAIGKEQSFLDLVKIIRLENLDKNTKGETDFTVLREKLTIDHTPLEVFTKRIIIRSLQYTKDNIDSVVENKRTLEALRIPPSAIDSALRAIDIKLDELQTFVTRHFSLPQEDSTRLDVVKVTTSRNQVYTLRSFTGKYNPTNEVVYRNMVISLIKLFKDFNSKAKGVVDIVEEVGNNHQMIKIKLHHYRKLNIEFIVSKDEAGNQRYKSFIRLEVPNLKSENVVKELAWK